MYVLLGSPVLYITKKMHFQSGVFCHLWMPISIVFQQITQVSLLIFLVHIYTFQKQFLFFYKVVAADWESEANMFQNWFSAMFEAKFYPDPLIKNAEVVLNHL